MLKWSNILIIIRVVEFSRNGHFGIFMSYFIFGGVYKD